MPQRRSTRYSPITPSRLRGVLTIEDLSNENASESTAEAQVDELHFLFEEPSESENEQQEDDKGEEDDDEESFADSTPLSTAYSTPFPPVRASGRKSPEMMVKHPRIDRVKKATPAIIHTPPHERIERGSMSELRMRREHMRNWGKQCARVRLATQHLETQRGFRTVRDAFRRDGFKFYPGLLPDEFLAQRRRKIRQEWKDIWSESEPGAWTEEQLEACACLVVQDPPLPWDYTV